MRCPDCGYEADNAAIFCPQCRFQFRDIIDEEPAYTADTMIDLPERGIVADESVFEEQQHEGERLPQFSEKERRQLEVQLIQPSVLVVLVIALFTYTTLYMVPFVPVSIAGMSIGITGILALACGIVAGLVFYLLEKRFLRNFRHR
jgi:hypothetical protein